MHGRRGGGRAPALAQRWQSFIDHARFEAVTASYNVLAAFDQAPGSPEERCAAVAIELGNARRTHPFSPLLARMDERCAADASARERAAAESIALRDFLLADGKGTSTRKPVLVMTEADALALVEQLGGEALYGRYEVMRPGVERAVRRHLAGSCRAARAQAALRHPAVVAFC